MFEIKRADFVTSCVDIKKYPDAKEIEFAFVGRSNVGKSSLINSLTNRKGLARTSRTPGRTQLVNFFTINEKIYFVDLPGYGYAKVPISVKSQWGDIIEGYLKTERKKIIFLLLDIRRIPSDEDLQIIEWMDYFNQEFKIIFTKADKLSNNEKFRQMKEIKKVIDFDNEDVFFHSIMSGAGRQEILNYIGEKIADAREEESRAATEGNGE